MISMNWVKDYIDLKGENLEELADKVTKAGVNVEHVISNNIKNLVIGEVIECTNHPDSDHLHVCKVNVGNENIQIVCGASNVRKGIKVIVALPGAILPGDFEIKKGKIRGVESNGMICALFELGLEEKTEENYNKGIHELESDAPIGEDAFEYLGISDTLYDLDVHKHKNNDCLYHIGFAYEVGAIIGQKVKLPESNYTEINDSIKDEFSLSVDTENCTYYKTKMVKDVVIGESPKFIKNRLISVGMRPINNVVDISNYVMLEYGQPLHFFDKDKLGNKVVVRMANDGEKVITLDEKERDLNHDDIVITDGKRVVAIAGVMGALNTDVDENTKTVLIESAIFKAHNIRKTEKHLNLRSEASMRYEKGLNYEYTDKALDRACYLLEKYANGKVCKDYCLYDNENKEIKKITFTAKKINSLLGLELTNKDIEEQLEKLDFSYEVNDDVFTTIIPRRRLDIEQNVNDIAEEIGRLYGYHNLKNTLPCLPTRSGSYRPNIKFRKEISKRLRTLGLDEVRTYSIVDEQTQDMYFKENNKIILPNPMSKDKTALRKTLIPSMLEVIKYNKARGLNDINIYEISKVFYNDFEEENHMAIALYGNYLKNSWENTTVKSDFYVLKGLIENILNYVGLKNRYSFVISEEKNLHPGISADILVDRKKIGFMGRIHPSISKDEIYVLELELDKINIQTKPIKYKEPNKYPKISKDVAFIVNKELTAGEILEQIKKSGGRLLSNIDVFDIYVGEKLEENKKSIAFNLTFEDQSRTLNDEEVTNVFNKIISDVESKFNAELRNK